MMRALNSGTRYVESINFRVKKGLIHKNKTITPPYFNGIAY
jgi:hypothetical protein